MTNKRFQRLGAAYMFAHHAGPTMRPGATMITGPTGVGKTYLCTMAASAAGLSTVVLDWNDPIVRSRFRKGRSPFRDMETSIEAQPSAIVVRDLLHYPKWKHVLLELLRRFGADRRFVLTGALKRTPLEPLDISTRLRLTHFELMPLSLREVEGTAVAACFLGEAGHSKRLAVLRESLLSGVSREAKQALALLIRHGPFPEPLCEAEDAFSALWHEGYAGRVIQDEIGRSSRIRDLEALEETYGAVSRRVGRTLSEAAVGRQVGASHVSVKSWLEWLERAYLLFSVPPWSNGVGRGLTKGKKWYLFDRLSINAPAAKIQNMVALALYRTCKVLNDLCLGNYALYYVKTIDQRGLDFLVVRDGRPVLAVDLAGDVLKPTRVFRNRSSWLGDPPPPGILVLPQIDGLEQHDSLTWSVGLGRFLRLLL